jgi:glycosyl transferase family 2
MKDDGPERPAPALSIVVAAWNGWEALRGCLESLHGQAAAAGAELIVARNFDGGAGAELARRFPRVLDLPLAPETTVPLLRAAGAARARGSAVALLEDACTVAAGWCEAMLGAHRLPHAAVGGPVDYWSEATPLDWAVYLYDYGAFAPPCAAGTTRALSGLNFSCKRAALERFGDSARDGIHEATIQAALLGRGDSLYLEPGALVVHRKHYDGPAARRHAFHLARSYAARRVAGAGWPVRLGRFATTLVLPLVLLARVVRQSAGRPRLRRALRPASGWLLVLLVAQSLGEAAGYLAGEGKSGKEWR